MADQLVTAETALWTLLDYCRANKWAGIEPYDVLNSKLLPALPIPDSRWPRLLLTQALKRSPINIRSFLLIPRTQNPKALALFLAGLLKLSQAGLGDVEDDIQAVIKRIVALRSPEKTYWCWGYNFPWQTRYHLVPRWAANLVCTSFVADALLDAYESRGNAQHLEIAESAANYLLDKLYFNDSKSVGFSYPLPAIRTEVYNANFLGAALFARVYRLTGRQEFLEPALAATRYSVARQQEDGSWFYGIGQHQRWIDNFHTGFNLLALQTIAHSLCTSEFNDNIRRGFAFYRACFFRDDGAVRYFHDRTYPIDSHCVAQSILTLLAFKEDPGALPLLQSVLDWAMAHLRNEQGYFYYRALRSCTIRTSYMRWTQAWMFLALARLVSEVRDREPRGATIEAVETVGRGTWQRP